MIKYSVVPFEDRPDAHWIRIDEGKFKGVRYTYGPVAVGEKPTADGSLPISFTYLLDGKQGVKDEDLPVLERVMGEILHEILLRMADNTDTLNTEAELLDIPDTGE